MLAVDVSPWLRLDAQTCPDRLFCHLRPPGDAEHQMIPGRPYSFVVALKIGRTTWSAVPDAVRLEPGADLAAFTTTRLRDTIDRLIDAGHWKAGVSEVLVVMDAGYDAPRIARLPTDLPVQVLGRLRPGPGDASPGADPRGVRSGHPCRGRPPKHGAKFVFGDPVTRGYETRDTLITTIDTRDHLDGNEGCEAVAAAALIAAQCSDGEPVSPFFGPKEPVPAFAMELRSLAVDALDRVLAPESELAELWDDTPDGPRWRLSIDQLRWILDPRLRPQEDVLFEI
ncbi:transposase [Embleya sp. NPDC020886]|uniref:transposase n=1 Tax=Embleya sp. NPDC020886 TaxID=3363980 RepID=UPI003787BA99